MQSGPLVGTVRPMTLFTWAYVLAGDKLAEALPVITSDGGRGACCSERT